jgi:hypothetical protein
LARVYRSGVHFDCPECGLLWKDDAVHGETKPGACSECGGDIRLVGVGNRIVESARWFRCGSCRALFMQRRGEIVPTGPWAGFDQFTEF